MKKLQFFLVTFLAVFLIIGSANATPMLKLTTSGGNSVTIYDNDLSDTVALTGAIGWIGTLGDWTFNSSIGLGVPVSGTTDVPKMDLSSINLSQTASSITIAYIDEPYIKGASPISFISSIGGTTNGEVEYSTYLSTDFINYSLISDMSFSSPAFSDVADVAANIAEGQQYSLKQVVTIRHGVAGTTSFNAALSIPEPGVMLLLGSGLIGLAALGRKKFFKKS